MNNDELREKLRTGYVLRGTPQGGFSLHNPEQSEGWTLPVEKVTVTALIEQNLVTEAFPELGSGIKTYRWVVKS